MAPVRPSSYGDCSTLLHRAPHALSPLFTIILSPTLWCVAVHGISMLESLCGRGPHAKGIGMGVDDINDFFFWPNKHPVIMIQFNHPCNICLRHIRGRLPRQSRVWAGLPLGRVDAWSRETQPPAPTPTHVRSPAHGHAQLARWAVSSQRALQNVPGLAWCVGGWSDVFV